MSHLCVIKPNPLPWESSVVQNTPCQTDLHFPWKDCFSGIDSFTEILQRLIVNWAVLRDVYWFFYFQSVSAACTFFFMGKGQEKIYFQDLLLHPLSTQNCPCKTKMHWIVIDFGGSGLHQSVTIPFPMLLKDQIGWKMAFDNQRKCDVSSCEAVGTIYLSATSQTLKPVCGVLWTNHNLNQDELLLYSSQQPSKSYIKEPNTCACRVVKSITCSASAPCIVSSASHC